MDFERMFNFIASVTNNHFPLQDFLDGCDGAMYFQYLEKTNFKYL